MIEVEDAMATSLHVLCGARRESPANVTFVCAGCAGCHRGRRGEAWAISRSPCKPAARAGRVSASVSTYERRRPTGTTHGYTEYRVQLKNSSDQGTHGPFDLSRRLLPYGRVNHGVVADRTVRVAGGQEVSVSLYQPPVEVANETMEVRVEGVRDGPHDPVGSLYGGHRHGFGRPVPTQVRVAVLLSRSVPQDFRDRGRSKAGSKSPAEEKNPKRSRRKREPEDCPPRSLLRRRRTATPATSPQPDPFEFLRSELPVGQWSPNWLGYSCYDVILVTEREAEEMPAPGAVWRSGDTWNAAARCWFTGEGAGRVLARRRRGRQRQATSSDSAVRRPASSGEPARTGTRPIKKLHRADPTSINRTRNRQSVRSAGRRGHGSRAGAVRSGAAVCGGHRPGEYLAALASTSGGSGCGGTCRRSRC